MIAFAFLCCIGALPAASATVNDRRDIASTYLLIGQNWQQEFRDYVSGTGVPPRRPRANVHITRSLARAQAALSQRCCRWRPRVSPPSCGAGEACDTIAVRASVGSCSRSR